MARTISRSAAERSNRALFIAALVFAGVAAVLFLVFLLRMNSGEGGTTVAAGELQQVVVANRDISAGEEITDRMLDITEVPRSALIPEVLQNEGDLQEGQLARTLIYKGDQISLAKVGEAPDDGSASSAVGDDVRVVGIGVEDVSSILGGLLEQGDNVDVVLVREVDLPDGGQRVETCMAAQAVRVFAVADEFNAAVVQGEDGAAQSSDDFESNPEAQSVQVEVRPSQVYGVTAAQEDGRVFLALRSNENSAEDASLTPCY
jgi:Flp pilus assembly protein CpaB